MALAVALDDVKSNQITLGSNLVGRKGRASKFIYRLSRQTDVPLASWQPT